MMMTREEYERALALRSQGRSLKEIGRQLNLHPATVGKWIRAGGPPGARAGGDVERVVNARWSARVAALLATDPDITGIAVYRTLVAEGFSGSYPTITRHLRCIRPTDDSESNVTKDPTTQENRRPSC